MVGPSSKSDNTVLINNLDVGNPLHIQTNDNSNIALILFKLLELESTYDKVDGFVIFNLLQKTNVVKQGGISVAGYYHRLNSLWIEFDALTKLPKCVCEVKSFESINDKQSAASTSSGFNSEQMQKLLSLINDNTSGSIHANMAVEFGGLYLFHMVKDNICGKSNMVMFFNVSKLLWHNRLGHAADQVLSVLHNDLNISKSAFVPVCEICHMDKQTKDPFPLSSHTSKYLGELVHLDLWGPYRVPTKEGFKLTSSVLKVMRDMWEEGERRRDRRNEEVDDREKEKSRDKVKEKENDKKNTEIKMLWLGHWINKGVIQMDQEKIRSVLDWEVPKKERACSS
ncbi:ribonuclease H-like domain-containing protein, partial [Tanacetum coccineum]